MKVYIEVSEWFKRYTNNCSYIETEVPEGSLAYDAVCSTGIPRGQIGFILLKSGETNALAGEEHPLREGDTVKVLPSIIGG